VQPIEPQRISASSVAWQMPYSMPFSVQGKGFGSRLSKVANVRLPLMESTWAAADHRLAQVAFWFLPVPRLGRALNLTGSSRSAGARHTALVITALFQMNGSARRGRPSDRPTDRMITPGRRRRLRPVGADLSEHCVCSTN